MIRAMLVAVALGCALASRPASGQDEADDWRWQPLPGPVAGAVAPDARGGFERMPPGWHVTTGGPGLLYSAREQASGNFSLVADFVIFPQTSQSGFGLFLGGEGLDGNAPSYTAALLRRDGAVQVVRVAAGQEEVLVPWTLSDAIKPHPGTGVVTNRLRVNASADSVRVLVNDSAVVRLAQDGARSAGHFGFAIGADVNVHLTILDHTRHLAPPRAR